MGRRGRSQESTKRLGPVRHRMRTYGGTATRDEDNADSLRRTSGTIGEKMGRERIKSGLVQSGAERRTYVMGGNLWARLGEGRGGGKCERL